MKVDLHCHTKATKGEGPKRNVTKELFADKIAAADIEIVAITNHNSFDSSNIRTFRLLCNQFRYGLARSLMSRGLLGIGIC